MGVLRLFGKLFVALGVVMLGVGAWLSLARYDLAQPAGQVWFTVDKSSLNLAQAVIQRYVYAPIWDKVMVPLLLLPTWQAVGLLVVIFVVIGGLLLIATRPRRRTFRR